ncbi:MAG: TIGR04282 family arsenosugar biosynthesis glycosyltransferase [candidate division Zixibacteria bacterium]|nr:TIGR04282 family arsenosugar biosynthesis glycosyltransferase [candidate division Zixibacteria bacterium]MBU1469085.1 TIGR04282 family arsenosugar biosynthesis glycosyltransferase [candidate division Zixibacteria bacterium]MBU2624661.1 TIGR04282 family arsenosugar biosynthesis glycosyltransferase [candidate division Zixibacteria bacterium]
MLSSSVGLMTKYPLLGKVKARLAAHIGDEKSLEVFTMLLQGAVNVTCSLDSSEFLRAAFIGAGGLIENFSGQYPGFDRYFRQDGEDLGERMATALSTLIEQEGARKAMLIGSDAPELTADIIKDANNLLGSHDLVLGPCVNGGYYLIGMRKVVPDLFFNIDWRSNDVLNATMETAGKKKLNVGLLPELRDLDTIDDLNYFKDRFSTIL